MACELDDRLTTDLTKFKGGKDFMTLAEHSSAVVRVKAVKALIKKVEHSKKINKKNGKGKTLKIKKIVPDKNPTARALVPRFADDNVNVLLTIWKNKISLLRQIFSEESLVSGILTTLRVNVSIKSNKFALMRLCDIAHRSSSEKIMAQVNNSFLLITINSVILNVSKYGTILNNLVTFLIAGF